EGDINDALFPHNPTFERFDATECIQRVQTIFQNDFDTYKYSKEYPY
ncbi:glyoxalase, partial [Bacillus cereus]|nr:glyoxalase [Bacillus cereus]